MSEVPSQTLRWTASTKTCQHCAPDLSPASTTCTSTPSLEPQPGLENSIGSICSAEARASSSSNACIPHLFQRLQPLLPDVEAWQAANILWGTAQLGLNPDALVPGMTESLARQFMVDMDAAIGQHFANVLVACAKLQLSSCQGGLFKAILNRLATADLSKFEPQDVANTLHSLATIPAAAPSVELLDALC